GVQTCALPIFLALHGIKSGNIAQSAQMFLEIEQDYQITRDPVLISTEDNVVVLIKKNWDEYLQARYPQEEQQTEAQTQQTQSAQQAEQPKQRTRLVQRPTERQSLQQQQQ